MENNQITVTLYIQRNCSDCVQAQTILEELKAQIPHQLAIIDLDQIPSLADYYPVVPVVETGPYRLNFPFNKKELEITLQSAAQRRDELIQSGDQSHLKRIERGSVFSGTDQASLWISAHYMVILNLLTLIYIGMPFLAPFLMKAGIPGPANVIYTVYSPLCHQLAFRSWFLFGEQPFYPRSLANLTDYKTYEQISGSEIIDIYEARGFNGDEHTGYKVALCERDVALYGSILIFGLVFSLSGRKIKSVKWYYWVIIGIIPMAIDGTSQLPSLISDFLPIWLPVRESTPLLRTITGSLFGWMTAWYLFPMIEESMLDTRKMLLRKSAIVNQKINNPG